MPADDGTADCAACGKLLLYTDRPGAGRPTTCRACYDEALEDRYRAVVRGMRPETDEVTHG